MKILSIDTSASVATASVTDDEKLVCEFIINTKMTHSQTLMPIIDSILKHSEIEISDIDLIAVANGPGSFTGLRIGVSTAKGIAHAKNIPMVGVSTLNSMAYNLPFCKYLISPIMDARREQVYNALYRWENDELKEIKAPRALGIDELLDELKAMGDEVVFLGDGVMVHYDTLKESLKDKAIISPACANMQRASSIAPLARKLYDDGKATDCFSIEPVYLRKSQAEREAEEKEKRGN